MSIIDNAHNFLIQTYNEDESLQRSFSYSSLFKVIIYSDLIVSIIIGFFMLLGVFFEIDTKIPQTFFLYFFVMMSVNFFLDRQFLKNRSQFPHSINIGLCWIKALAGILGFYTSISGIYFLIISEKMRYAHLVQLREENARLEKEKREQFVKSQKEKGLVSYTDHNGNECWCTPDEIEKIRKKIKEEAERESLLFNVSESIRRFKPERRWGNENNYHIELLGWLKREFPGIVQYELQSGSSRPDLSIQAIAIEIKGPTDNNALNTLASKLLRYEQYYQYIIIVLFECYFSEGVYLELKTGIEKHFKNVTIIRK